MEEKKKTNEAENNHFVSLSAVMFGLRKLQSEKEKEGKVHE